MGRFCLRGPDGLWFARRDPVAGIDIFTASVRNACVFTSEESATAYAGELLNRSGGDYWMVYQLFAPVRRLGGLYR